MTLTLENTYAEALDGAFVAWRPAGAPAPRRLRVNHALAQELGLAPHWLDSDEALQLFAGNLVPAGATPLAQAYAGHQFGSYSPLLGDGRALLMGEVLDPRGHRWDLALKGSGATPFSRGGDGKAALGPVLREYVMGEAMHALGIPTTRALAAVATGELVRRDGHLPGAVLTRVAASHLRVGTFEFAARRSPVLLAAVADYSIERHYPELAELPAPQRYLQLLAALAARQAKLIAQWLGVGFIHGVMNTDNTTISGETIDYGPCAFMEAYDPGATFSSIDHGRRYAYANQPGIALWNLARFAETLVPLVVDSDSPDAAARAAEQLSSVLAGFEAQFEAEWVTIMRSKLALPLNDPSTAAERPTSTDAEVRALAESYLELLRTHRVDLTLGWRRLIPALAGPSGEQPLRDLFANSSAESDESWHEVESWLSSWREALSRNGDDESAAAVMNRANPVYIPRNHVVEEVLDAAATDQDLGPLDELLAALADPFTERAGLERFAEPAPREVTARYRTFCGT